MHFFSLEISDLKIPSGQHTSNAKHDTDYTDRGNNARVSTPRLLLITN